MSGWTQTARGHLLAAGVAVASAVLMTWPLAANAGHQVLRAMYYWDAYTNAMILGSRVDALLGRGPLSLYDDYYFAPLPHSIVFNENHFGLSLIFAPFYVLSHNPLWAYNLTLLASLALSVFFTYLLVLRLTGSGYAGLLAGVAFAYCPFVLFEIGRIQLVATQWIPATFLLLQRAIEQQRRRDSIGFWLCVVLQIGTCLYNAMFLVPLLALAGGALLVRQRPPLRFFYWFGGAALGAGLVVLLMVQPYFSARHAFDLERSLSFASSYDGKLSFFGNVPLSNRTWTSLHQASKVSHEEIAFPGLSVLLLACLGISLPMPAWFALRQSSVKWAWSTLLAWSALAIVSGGVTLLGHSMLPGVLVFGGGAWWLALRGVPHPFGGTRGLYLAVLLLAVALFLGLEPLAWHGAPVRGLYYYFYRYFPGFDGIRKVSRQAVMTTFTLCVLAGFGAAWLFSKLERSRDRFLAATVLLAVLCYELRCFPHTTEPVWAGEEVPAVLRFVESLPAPDMIAFTPQNAGRQRFRGDAGMALYNYLALYHQHRFVNGQSSWQPPVTELARRALEHLPDDGARRALLSIGTRHLVVFGDDLKPTREPLPAALEARPLEYRRIFQQRSDSVFTLLDPGDPSLEPLQPSPLPSLAKLIPASDLHARSSLQTERAALAVDGRAESYWSSGRIQESGQYFEVELNQPRPIVALEITAPGRVMDVPVSYRLSAEKAGQDLGVVAEQPVLRFYHAQIFSPQTFVFRVVFAQPLVADRIRLTVEQPVPGHYFSISELRLYEQRSQ
ncbi:MAG: discoidin domain-containing protein [Polyangiaceae bacterium]